jgi:hypothetical protein
MRQLIVRKIVVSMGEEKVSHKRPFLRHADPPSEFPTIVLGGKWFSWDL